MLQTRAGIKQITLYSSPTQSQFINQADGRARGEGNNPFGNYSGSSVTPPTNEKIFGPFPTDWGEYAFQLYTSASRKTSAGSAIFVCQYNFNQDSFCDASFQLDGGSLIGAGAANFNSSTFTLAIIGGTYKYRSMEGAVEVSAGGVATQTQPVARAVPMLQEQRLAFVIRSV